MCSLCQRRLTPGHRTPDRGAASEPSRPASGVVRCALASQRLTTTRIMPNAGSRRGAGPPRGRRPPFGACRGSPAAPCSRPLLTPVTLSADGVRWPSSGAPLLIPRSCSTRLHRAALRAPERDPLTALPQLPTPQITGSASDADLVNCGRAGARGRSTVREARACRTAPGRTRRPGAALRRHDPARYRCVGAPVQDHPRGPRPYSPDSTLRGLPPTPAAIDLASLYTLRAEDLTAEELEQWTGFVPEDQSILRRLMGPGPKLLKGPRGSGKSNYLKRAYYKLSERGTVLVAYINYSQHLALEPLMLRSERALEYFRQWLVYKVVIGVRESLASDSPQDLVELAKAGALYIEELQTVVGETPRHQPPLLSPAELLVRIEAWCDLSGRSRAVLLMDDAAHAFMAQQQREFSRYSERCDPASSRAKQRSIPGSPPIAHSLMSDTKLKKLRFGSAQIRPTIYLP